MTNISALCDVTMLSSVRRNISRISESSGFLSSYQFVLSSPVELRYGLTSFSTLASRPIMKGITTRVASAYGRYATTAATSALVACCFYNGFSTAHAQSAAQPPSSYASSEATTSTVHAAPSPVDKGPYDDVDEKALERSGPKYEDPRVKGLTVVVAANIEDVCYDPTADVIIKVRGIYCACNRTRRTTLHVLPLHCCLY